MDSFTPLASTLGGALIGLAASLLLLANGRIAGISGIFAGLLSPKAGEVAWRLSFVAGLVLGGLAVFLVAPSLFAFTADRTLPVVAIGGLLVGVGVRLGDGCTGTESAV